MQALPHHYEVQAKGEPEGDILVESRGLPDLNTAAPAHFDGPGDKWSPEHLLTAAVANCFILTFRALARGFKLEWKSLQVETEGTLDKVEKQMRFTGFQIKARLAVPAGTDPDKARRILEKAEQGCLITNSLACDSHLHAEVTEK
ncbi:MAG: OsmC family protein [Candidatus Omnitrophica bacterium]|nr:OsmC family protein [Candidatus Omnitrophota bacterium]